MDKILSKINYSELFQAIENVFINNVNSKVFLVFKPDVKNDETYLYTIFFKSITPPFIILIDNRVKLFKKQLELMLLRKSEIETLYINNEKLSLTVNICYKSGGFDFNKIKKIHFNQVQNNFQVMLCQ